MPSHPSEADDLQYMARSCFVIMPFGEKIDTAELANGQGGPSTGQHSTVQILPGQQVQVIDFDRIYKKLIEPAVNDAAVETHLSLKCIRSDEIGHSGFIHSEMLERVTSADIAIVDITTQNANVFYELGVRHSFRRATTVLIQRIGTHIPFNIAGMRVFPYSDDETPDSDGKTQLLFYREKLKAVIVASLTQRDNDSLVHHLLPDVSVVRVSWPIMEQHTVWYDILDRDGQRMMVTGSDGNASTRSVGFITGDIVHIKSADVWVNPENTKMQMARYYDGSISSVIRYFGARRNRRGHVIEDTIADALRKRLGSDLAVEPGVVVTTGSGRLRETNNVKLIIHVAALQGEPGRGYQPIRDYPGCVRRVLLELHRLNTLAASSPRSFKWSFRRKAKPEGVDLTDLECTNILFPLFATRSFGQHPQSVAEDLFRAAVVFLEQQPDSLINTVYFLASTQQDRELCERALGLLQSNGRIVPSSRSLQQAGDPAQFGG